MAQYRTTIESTWSPEEAFEYMSDFGNTRDWDPSELQYRITEYQPVQRVVMTAETPRLRSVDEVTFEPAGASSGTRVTYDAALTLKGPYRLADPLLQRAFNRLGDAAAVGLERELNR